jgi:hypothetical protein
MENKNDQPLPPEPEKGAPPRKKLPQVKAPMQMKGFAAWFLMMAVVLMALQFFQKPEQQEQTSYNPDFVQLVKAGRIIR